VEVKFEDMEILVTDEVRYTVKPKDLDFGFEEDVRMEFYCVTGTVTGMAEFAETILVMNDHLPDHIPHETDTGRVEHIVVGETDSKQVEFEVGPSEEMAHEFMIKSFEGHPVSEPLEVRVSTIKMDRHEQKELAHKLDKEGEFYDPKALHPVVWHPVHFVKESEFFAEGGGKPSEEGQTDEAKEGEGVALVAVAAKEGGRKGTDDEDDEDDEVELDEDGLPIVKSGLDEESTDNDDDDEDDESPPPADTPLYMVRGSVKNLLVDKRETVEVFLRAGRTLLVDDYPVKLYEGILTIHSHCTHHTLPIHSQYTHHTLTLHSPYTHHTLPIHSPYTPHTLPNDHCSLRRGKTDDSRRWGVRL
jgi:hypothetical protein